MKKTISGKTIVSLLAVAVLTGGVITLAQHRQTSEGSQPTMQKNSDPVAAPSPSPDEVQRVTVKSVRRINLVINNNEAVGKNTVRTLPRVGIVLEITNFCRRPAENSFLSVAVGDKAFDADGEENKLIFEMSQAEFDALPDNSYIFVMYGSSYRTQERLKEIYQNGEPAHITDEKCCRLNKKMIDEFPPAQVNSIPPSEPKKP